MVVDEDIESDQQQRRYLAYDLMMLNGKSLMQQPFKVRACLFRPECHVPCKSGSCFARESYSAQVIMYLPQHGRRGTPPSICSAMLE